MPIPSSTHNFAPVHGLAADCLIRLGRTREAASRWKESENATEGTLVKLESLVCEIYKDPSLNQRRALLRAKAEKGDVDAAVRLIALDGRFEHDWWLWVEARSLSRKAFGEKLDRRGHRFFPQA